MVADFIPTHPADEISRQLDLFRSVGDPTHVDRYTEFEDWFKHTQDIPGAFYLWIVRHLFADNALIHGGLEIGGPRGELDQIDMPPDLVRGGGGHLNPPAPGVSLWDAVGNPP